MKVLYVGKMWEGQTSRHRFEAMKQAGYSVDAVSVDPIWDIQKGWGYRLMLKVDGVLDTACVNQRLRRAVRRKSYEVIWVDKGIKVSPKTLRTVKHVLPQAKLISYSPDDMLNPANQTRRYLASLPLYDLHVTTKSYNVSELKELGAREVRFVPNAFEPTVHYPDPDLGGEYVYEVSFVGAWERERADFLERLAIDRVPVLWHCPGWPVGEPKPKHLRVITGQLRDRAYAQVLQQSKINLAFLRKQNRDLQTQRTMEIPGCGGFMLAEYSTEHDALFKEGVEAEFFRNYEECVKKIRYYLDHEEVREQVAKAGCQLVWSTYTNEQMIKSVLGNL